MNAYPQQTGSGAAAPQYQYDAFISYRHREPDRTIAVRLEERLERYRLPKELAARIGDRRLHCFRDEDELQTASNLSDAIDRALTQSRFLICICSPAYLESRWCMQEINHFKAMHRGSNENIILLVAEAGDDPTRVFPEQLTHETRYVTDERGMQRMVEVGVEPLAGNVAAPDVRESLKKLKTESLRIAAPLFGIGFNDLYDRDRRREVKRRRRIVAAAFAAVSLIALYSTFTMLRIYRQNVRIRRQSLQLYENSVEMAMAAGNRKMTVQYARDAMEAQVDMDGKSRPDTERILAKAAGLYTPGEGMAFGTRVALYGMLMPTGTFYNTDGSALVVTEVGKTHILDAHTGEERFSLPVQNILIPDERFAGKDCLFLIGGLEAETVREAEVAAYDLLTGERRWSIPVDLRDYDDPYVYLTGHNDTGTVALVMTDSFRAEGEAVFLDAETGAELRREPLPDGMQPGGRLVMTESGTLVYRKYEELPEEAIVTDDGISGSMLARFDDGRYVLSVSDTTLEVRSSIPSLNYRLLHGEENRWIPQDVSEHYVDPDKKDYACSRNRFACIVRQYTDAEEYGTVYDGFDTVRSYEIPVYDTQEETLLSTIRIDNGDGALWLFGLLFTDEDHLLLYGWDGYDTACAFLYRTDGTLADSRSFSVIEEEGVIQAGRDASLLVMSGHVVSAGDEKLTVTPLRGFTVTGARVDETGRWAATAVLADGRCALLAGEGEDWNGAAILTDAGNSISSDYYCPVLSPGAKTAACADAAAQTILLASADGARTNRIPVEHLGSPMELLFPDEDTLLALWYNGEIRCYDVNTGEEIRSKETYTRPVGTAFGRIGRIGADSIVVGCDGYGLVLDRETLEICAELPYYLCTTADGGKIIARVEHRHDPRMDKDNACIYIGDLLDREALLLRSGRFLQETGME